MIYIQVMGYCLMVEETKYMCDIMYWIIMNMFYYEHVLLLNYNIYIYIIQLNTHIRWCSTRYSRAYKNTSLLLLKDIYRTGTLFSFFKSIIKEKSRSCFQLWSVNKTYNGLLLTIHSKNKHYFSLRCQIK